MAWGVLSGVVRPGSGACWVFSGAAPGLAGDPEVGRVEALEVDVRGGEGGAALVDHADLAVGEFGAVAAVAVQAAAATGLEVDDLVRFTPRRVNNDLVGGLGSVFTAIPDSDQEVST